VKGVSLVAISVDPVDDSTRLAGKLGIGFPLLSDPKLETALAYGVAMKGDDIAVPSIFIVGRDRRIHYRHIGETILDRPTPDTILDAIDRMRGARSDR
jgi:peroxiredoxin